MVEISREKHVFGRNLMDDEIPLLESHLNTVNGILIPLKLKDVRAWVVDPKILSLVV